MIIDDKTHRLGTNNFIPIKTEKKRIVIGNTFNTDMRHVIGWKTRLNGYYKKTASFTIAKDGTVFKHFNPDFYSHFYKSHDTNSKTITILIENEGWLIKDENNQFINLLGHIYKEPSEVYEKKWRSFHYWAPYTKEQLNAAVELVEELCREYKISPVAIIHNTKIDIYDSPFGVFYKSNLEPHYTDVNPNWYFEEFKTTLERYEQQPTN